MEACRRGAKATGRRKFGVTLIPGECGEGAAGRPREAGSLWWNATKFSPARYLGMNTSHGPLAILARHWQRDPDEVRLDRAFARIADSELRFGNRRYPIRKHDVIACPPGGPDVAHQIINTGTTTMRYLALSTLSEVDACEYPDSQKVLIVTGQGSGGLRKMIRAENTVDYYDREPT